MRSVAGRVASRAFARILRVLADLIVIKMLIQFSAHPVRWFSLLSLPMFLVAPLLFILGTFKFNRAGELVVAEVFDLPLQAAGGVALLVGLNLFLLGFLAELQTKVSGLFRRRSAITVREAAR